MTVHPKKSLAQHFLVDPNYCRKIVRFSAVTPQDTVVEIGPGTGRLTRALLAAAGRVIAVEFDRSMVDYLKTHLLEGQPEHCHRLQLVQDDILTLDWAFILGTATVKIIGNLPYNIATRILQRTLEVTDRFLDCTVMVQKEVARRILALPGSHDYGFFSLLMEYHFERIEGFDVPPGVFVPRPKVVSSVLKLVPRQPPCRVSDYPAFVNFLKAAFQQRRKTLVNNLARHYPRPAAEAALQACRLPPNARPEQVSLQEFACLMECLPAGGRLSV